MVAGFDTFALSIMLGLIIGSINAYFRYGEEGRRAAFRTFVGWLLAFTITGLIATPVADWLLQYIY